MVARASKYRQLGQSMAEYTVVAVALVTGVLVANQGCSQYDSCIEAVQVALHDNYAGYAGSISAVHEYQSDYDLAGPDSGSSSGSDSSGDSSSGGGGGGGITVTGLSTVTTVSDATGSNDYGYLQSDGTVTASSSADSEVQGTYDEATGTYTDASTGASSSVVTNERVVDEDGNTLQMHAFTSCSGDPKTVYGFGYQSEATGTYYDTSFAEQDLDDDCFEPSFKAVDDSNADLGGRIVDGMYYAVTAAPYSATGIIADGEVIYWDYGDGVSECVIMVSGWDDSVDYSQDDDDIYADQLELYNADDSPRMGQLDSAYYVEQTVLYGEASWPNDCVSNRTISAP